jgi:hypothetical protein
MHCIEQDQDGRLVIMNPQPADLSACAMLVPSGQAVVGNPFALDVEAGAALSVAIISVWAIAFAFRSIMQTLSVKGSNHEEVSA